MRSARIILAVAVIFSLTLVNVHPAKAAEMELKAICWLPKNHPLTAMLPTWIQRVDTQLKGTLRINWVGGSEVMPGFNQPEALRKGIFQLAFIPTAFYYSMLPEADAISLSPYDFKKEREKGGIWDYMVDRHKKINMVPLATIYYDPFLLYVKKPVTKLDDLKGLRMRTAAKYDRMMKKMGIVPVTVEAGETYTALQRGVVDGFGWPTIGPRELGWLENTKYVIDVPFYSRPNGLIIMNLDIWNKLTKDAQAKLVEISTKFDLDMKAYFLEAIDKEQKEWDKIGVKKIKFSAEDTKKFGEIADSATMEDLEKKAPNEAKTIRKILGLP